MNRRIIIIIIAFAAVCSGASAQQKQGKADEDRKYFDRDTGRSDAFHPFVSAFPLIQRP